MYKEEAIDMSSTMVWKSAEEKKQEREMEKNVCNWGDR